MDGPQIDELKELVKVSLQQAGVLGSIKARLRAEVFKVVNKEQAATAPSSRLAAMNTSEGQVAADLVREFLEHFELHSTLSVFLPEASLENGYPGRKQLAQRLGIADESGVPLLVSMMKNSGSRGGAVSSSRPLQGDIKGVDSSDIKGASALRPPMSPYSPAQSSPQGTSNSKFAFGGGGESEGLDRSEERVRKLQSLAQEGGVERRSPGSGGENESDESLTSTTRRLYVSKPTANEAAHRMSANSLPPSEYSSEATSRLSPKIAAASSSAPKNSTSTTSSPTPNSSIGSGSGSIEKSLARGSKPPAVKVDLNDSKDVESDLDIVEEDIDVVESEPDTPSPYIGKKF
jgi:hypothetical protein